jgi:hypothetical protein
MDCLAVSFSIKGYSDASHLVLYLELLRIDDCPFDVVESQLQLV